MIQRKQTLFLLAVAIIAIILFFIPFQKVSSPESVWSICLMPSCSSDIMDTTIYIPMILNVLILIVTIATIFLYKKRVLQFKLANLLVLFNMLIVGLFFLLTYVKAGTQGTISYEFGAFLPIISAALAYFAGHFIKKDEQLVRNADRIR